MSGITEATAAKQRRRKAVVAGLVDKIIAAEDEIADVHARRKRRANGEAARLKDAEVAYKAAAKDADAAVADITGSIDALATAVGAWDEAAARLVQNPGALVYLAKVSRRRRFGSFLSRRLFDFFGSDFVGPIRLNAQGCRVPTKFAEGEAKLLERIRLQLFHPIEEDPPIRTNGAINGHDISEVE